MDRQHRILVVEDEKTQRRQIRMRLEEEGYSVLESANGWEASRLFLENPDIRLVLTDLLMPEMDGFQFIEFIREMQSRYVYIIVLTILEDRDSIIRALSLGADDYICKPVFREELLLRLEGGRRLLRLESRDALVFSLARLAAFNTGESPFRLHRIREYSRVIAMDMVTNDERISSRQAQDIAELSPLLDIGKVAVPPEIWSHRGRLSRTEEEMIRQHPAIGAQVINATAAYTGADGLTVAHGIIRSHHERWDGCGYPDGLEGEEIPLPARIVALVDAYEAMTSGSAHRREMLPEEAAKEIVAGSGSQFDPLVVAAFKRRQVAMAEVMVRYGDDRGEKEGEIFVS